MSSAARGRVCVLLRKPELFTERWDEIASCRGGDMPRCGHRFCDRLYGEDRQNSGPHYGLIESQYPYYRQNWGHKISCFKTL